MANDGRIYIIVTDKYPGGAAPGPGPSPFPAPEQKDEKASTNKTWGYLEHRFANFLEQQAMKAVNYSLSNIGNFTGDYQAQRDVNAALTTINNLSNIAIATLAGAKYGPWGAAAGALIAISNIAINTAYENKTIEIQQAKADHNIKALQQRSGLNSLYDGSRGTEN